MTALARPLPRDEVAGDTVPGALFDTAWEPAVPGRRRILASWKEYVALASRVVGRFHGEYRLGHFDYEHPTRLQQPKQEPCLDSGFSRKWWSLDLAVQPN